LRYRAGMSCLRRTSRAALVAALAAAAAAQAPAPEPLAVDAAAHVARGERLKAAIDAGHDWLKRHQNDDGSFSASTFVVHDPRGQPTDGPGKPDQDVFVTALVIKSWSGMGWLPDGKGTHPHVCRATEWLFSQLRDDGSIGLPNSSTRIRDTGLAGEVLHWAGVYHADWKGRFDGGKAARWLGAQRLPGGRWPASPKAVEPDWATDWLVTSFVSVTDQALLVGGSPFVVDGALRACSDAEVGGAAYIAAWAIRDPDVRRAACEQALRQPPRVHVREDRVDYLSWYGTTQGMQFEAAAAWRTWWHALTGMAVAMQRTDGSFAGSWDPLDVRGREGGRVYATAAMLVTLEVAWRKEYRDR
ncbi:MAG: terpene cyclase/mutase family protein, partial [Planctomycetes bacterium]|nr:terpene cyclase/mutase family protein [Planctomycetota bacterium]